jgi:hypothetical protein
MITWDHLIMADSDAVRSRRYRLHRAGNHSLCRDCGHRPPLEVAQEGDPLEVDPAAGMTRLAAGLAAAYDADPGNALLARELRMTLQALGPAEKAVDGELAELLGALRR